MPGLRAVIDTSVMVSVAFAQTGLAKEIRELIAEGAFQMVTSKAIVAELYRVLHYPRIRRRFKPTQADVEEFIGLILERAILTAGHYQVRKIAADPSDDMFLACALEGQAGYIVSRDPHLRDLKAFQGIQIVDVKSFVETVRQSRQRT